MTNIELFRKHFNNEYPNEEQLIVEIEEHTTVQDTTWVKIIFTDPEIRKHCLSSNPELFAFANILAKSIGYSGAIIGSVTAVLELYICGETESRWWEPGTYGTHGTSGVSGTSGTSGVSGTAGYSGMTCVTGMTINPCGEIPLPETRHPTLEPIPIPPKIIKDSMRWRNKFLSKKRRI